MRWACSNAARTPASGKLSSSLPLSQHKNPGAICPARSCISSRVVEDSAPATAGLVRFRKVSPGVFFTAFRACSQARCIPLASSFDDQLGDFLSDLREIQVGLGLVELHITLAGLVEADG